MNEQNEQIPFETECAQSTQPQEESNQKWWQKILSELKSKDMPFYKRKWVWIGAALLVIIVAILAFSGDRVQDDLIDYINNDLKGVIALEEETLDLYEQARESSTDYAMCVMIQDQVIPKSMELIDAVEAIEPETEEVREVHELYIKAVNSYNQAFTLMVSALQEQDYTLVTQANEKLDAARKTGRDYVAAIKKLAEEHNVVFEN